MARIDYTLDTSDAIAFKQATIASIEVPHSVNSERKVNWFLTLAFAALALALLLLLPLEGALVSALGFGLMAAFYAFRTPLGWRYRRWRARQAVAREAPQDLLPMGQANRSLLTSQRYLIHCAQGIEYRILWTRIDAITITDTRAFLSVNGTPFLVIPRHSVTKGDFGAFIAEAASHIPDAAQQLAEADSAGARKGDGGLPAELS